MGRGHGNLLPGDYDSVLVLPQGYQLRRLNLLGHEGDLGRSRVAENCILAAHYRHSLFHGGDFLLHRGSFFLHVGKHTFVGSTQLFAGLVLPP